MFKGTQTNQLAIGDFTGSPPPSGGTGAQETDSQFDIMKTFGTDGNAYIRYRLKGFDHLMPKQDVLDGIGGFQHNNSLTGGLRQWGISNESVGLRLIGFGATSDNTVTSLSDGAIKIQGYKRNLANVEDQAGELPNDANLAAITNAGRTVAVIKGDGTYMRVGGGSSGVPSPTTAEGDWTGSFAGTGGGSIVTNSTASTGYYQKDGRKVTVTGLFTIASVSGPSGHLVLSGLPFSGSAGAKYRTSATINIEGLPSSFNSPVMATIQGNSNIYITKLVNGVATAMAGDVQAGTAVFVSATYFTD